MLEFGYKSYFNDQLSYLGKYRVERFDSTMPISASYNATSGVMTILYGTLENTRSAYALGLGYGRPLGIGSWRNAMEIQDTLIKHKVLSGPLPGKTMVDLIRIIDSARGDTLSQAKLLADIHALLTRDNLIGSQPFDVTIALELTKIFKSRLRELQDSLEVRAYYERVTNTLKLKSGSIPGDSSYSDNGSATELDLIYKRPINDLTQLTVNPRYVNEKTSAEGFTWKIRTLSYDIIILYAASEVINLELKHTFNQVKIGDSSGDSKTRRTALSLLFDIW